MIYVDESSCTGCGECLAICPTGAICLEGNVAVIDQDECIECQACLEVCPEGAILSVSEPEEAGSGLPATRPAPEVIHVRVPQTPVPTSDETLPTRWQAAIVPAVTGALAFVGRELPRLLPAVLDLLDRRSARPAATNHAATNGTTSGAAPTTGGGGRQRRRRRRGG